MAKENISKYKNKLLEFRKNILVFAGISLKKSLKMPEVDPALGLIQQIHTHALTHPHCLIQTKRMQFLKLKVQINFECDFLHFEEFVVVQ